MVPCIACYQIPTSATQHPWTVKTPIALQQKPCGIIPADVNPILQRTQKNYINIKKYFSQHLAMWDFKYSQWTMMKVLVICDVTMHGLPYWIHTYFPVYIVLYTRRLEYWPFSMFFIPSFRSSFYNGFHICLDLVSQKVKFLFKPRCLLERCYCIISHSSSYITYLQASVFTTC